jgi:rhodanese-related sulfurtransferase
MVPEQHGVVRRIDVDEAAALVAQGRVQVLDVRTPQEFEHLGHIPGARLLPVDLVTSAPAVLDAETSWLVCCEHGIRSQFAADVLVRAGFTHVLDMAGGMACWSGVRSHAPAPIEGPSPWLLECASLLPEGGRAADVACGRGRHALLLASAGFEVRAFDRDEAAIAALQSVASRLGLQVETECLDLERGSEVELGVECFDVLLVVHYLHRPLFPALVRALLPGGLLLYETFTRAQARRGRPTRPEFLLEPGELPQLVAPLRVLASREGESAGRDVAAVAARKD